MATGDIVVSRASEDGLSVVFVCGPCESLVTCCVYPWPDPDAPLYPAEDLPDLLNVPFSAPGPTFTHNGFLPAFILAQLGAAADGFYFASEGLFIGDPDYTKYSVFFAGNAEFNDVSPEVETEGQGPGWFFADFYVNDTESFVEGFSVASSPCLIRDGVEDEFADTYSVNGTDTITRGTPCTWNGPKTGGGTWSLNYGQTTPYKWHLTSGGGSPTSDDKDDPQSSPDGTYGSETVA